MSVEVHPSHESTTKQPHLKIGQRVSFAGQEGAIEKIINSGSEQTPIFEYLVKYDNEEANSGRGWLRSSDMLKI